VKSGESGITVYFLTRRTQGKRRGREDFRKSRCVLGETITPFTFVAGLVYLTRSTQRKRKDEKGKLNWAEVAGLFVG